MENYLAAVNEFYSQIIKENDLCFDIGAHVGTKTKLFLDLCAKVICVEPQLSCCKELKKSYGHRNIVIINKGLAEKEGSISFYICEDATTISTISKKWMNIGRFSKGHKWGNPIRISVTTLDKLIEIYGTPKFCKIDVEGSEYRVLQGSTTLIPYLSFEFTSEFISDAKKCVDYLLSLGPAQFNFTMGALESFILPNWVSRRELFNRINDFIPKWDKLWGNIYAAKID